MTKKYKAFAVVPLALAVSAAWAQTEERYTTLDTSVVSASGYEQDVREAPASVSVVTNGSLLRISAQRSVMCPAWISILPRWVMLAFQSEASVRNTH